jgi:flavodoxin I
MGKVGIFYGSTLGNTRKIAERIGAAFGADHAQVINIENASIGHLESFENLVLGTSTWGVGEMQEDWETFARQLHKIDLSAKKIALFGVGDQVEWSDSFVNGMGMLHHKLADKATIVGFTSVQGYNFDISLALKNGQFVGLAIDEVNQSALTDERISQWVEALQKIFI